MADDSNEGAGLRSRYLHLSQVRLHLVEAGPVDGAPIVLLHGFPEFWYGWREQLAALPGWGCRVIAPDQRGYNRSGKPAELRAYALPRLTDDVVELLDQLKLERVVLAGHDWGGAVAWWLAMHHPDRVRHLIALDAPHPFAIQRALRRSWRQRLRSSYMLFFQIPWLAEWSLTAAGGWLLARALQRSRVKGRFSEEELDRYRRAWRRPGAMRGMLSWYRAVYRDRVRGAAPSRVTVPTTVVWGEMDPFFTEKTLQDSRNYCRQAGMVGLPGCGHWVQHEAAGRITELLAERVLG